MKKNFLNLIVILFVVLFLGIIFKPSVKPFISLSSFAHKVQKCCPVHKGVVKGSGELAKHTALTKEEFGDVLQKYTAMFNSKQDFFEPSSWVETQSPSQGLFALSDYPFATKAVLPGGAEVLFCGDLHGSIHSLLQMLDHLIKIGYLADDFTLVKDNFYIMFLGDFVDRGWYGSEVIYLLARLKMANWDRIFLLRGNHEDINLNNRFGFTGHFLSETMLKFGKVFCKDILDSLIDRWYSCLPHVLFLDNGTKSWIQCCHGGLQKGYSPIRLLESNKKFQYIPGCEGFNWSDVTFSFEEKLEFLENSSRGAGWVTTVEGTEHYLKNNGLYALMRGHQDQGFWLKMFFPRNRIFLAAALNQPYVLSRSGRQRFFQKDFHCTDGTYPYGPYNWEKVVSEDEQHDPRGFLLSNYPPIFTFSHAAESRKLQTYGLGIVKMQGPYSQWCLQTVKL